MGARKGGHRMGGWVGGDSENDVTIAVVLVADRSHGSHIRVTDHVSGSHIKYRSRDCTFHSPSYSSPLAHLSVPATHTHTHTHSSTRPV